MRGGNAKDDKGYARDKRRDEDAEDNPKESRFEVLPLLLLLSPVNWVLLWDFSSEGIKMSS